MNLRGLIVWAAYRKGANLRGANLQEADLRGAVSSKRLLRLNGFKYDVIRLKLVVSIKLSRNGLNVTGLVPQFPKRNRHLF